MGDVFDLIFSGLVSFVKILQDFELSAYGFTTSLWDICIAFIFIDLIISLLFVLRGRSNNGNGSGSGGSERAPKKGSNSDAD